MLANEERWADARDAFEVAWAAYPRPSIAFNLAASRFRVGEYVKAREALDDYARMAAPDDEYREQAQRLREDLAGWIATVRLSVVPAESEVLIDDTLRAGSGAVRRFDVDPGTHRLRVQLAEYEAQEQQVHAAPGQSIDLRVVLGLQPRPILVDTRSDTPPSKASEVPWTWIAVGAVVIASVTTVTLVTLSDPGQLKSTGGSTLTVLQAPR